MKTLSKLFRTVGQVLLLVVLSGLLGAACGWFMLQYELFDSLDTLQGPERIAVLLWFVAAFGLTYFLEIALHEAGHLLCGLWSGYRFVSYRLGSVLWMKENGRIVRKRFSLAGTGGQCLMEPPGDPGGEFPQVFYNMGGVLMNLVTGLLFLAVLLLPSARRSLFCLPLLVFGTLSAFISAIFNGVPLAVGPVPNDGWNALHLLRDREARRAFWVMLTVNARQYEGIRLKEMPSDWFTLPSREAMKNGLTATLAVLAENRAMDQLDFSAAETLFPVLQDKTCRIADLYKRLLVCDIVCCALLREGAAADISPLSERQTAAVLKQMRDYPSVLRTRYAVALLHDGNEAEAAKILDRFEKTACQYPAKADIASERELIALVKKRFSAHNFDNGT